MTSLAAQSAALSLTGCAHQSAAVTSQLNPEAIEVPRTLSNKAVSKKLYLGQPWRQSTGPEFKPAAVRVAWTPETLIVKAVLSDDEVSTLATDDNQKMWQLGDVFEMFLQAEGRADYVELHITPNNRRMHLHLPGPGGRSAPDAECLPFENMLVTPVGFSSKVTRTSKGWNVSVKVPAAVLGLVSFKSGNSLRVSFCRYDYAKHRELVLSTTSPHPVISFHRPDEWLAAKLID